MVLVPGTWLLEMVSGMRWATPREQFSGCPSAAAPIEFGANLVSVEGVARCEIGTRLPEVGERFVIAEDVERRVSLTTSGQIPTTMAI
jgi:hypothetical protein